jgi:hypothetical protein
LRAVTDEVVARWGRAEREDLLNHVYVETAPMRAAVRGQELDLAAEASEAGPVENYAPLEPPQVSEQLRQRAAEWRRNLRAAPKPAPLGVAGGEEEWALMAVGEMTEPADPQAVMVRGRLGSAAGLEAAD